MYITHFVIWLQVCGTSYILLHCFQALLHSQSISQCTGSRNSNFIPHFRARLQLQVSTMYSGTSDQYGCQLDARHFMTQKPFTFKYPQNVPDYTVNSGY